MSAAVDGRILTTDCGLTLQRGFRSVWEHRYEGDDCSWERIDRVLEFDGPEPNDPLDEQQYAVYDWEYEVAANLLTAAWRRPVTFDSAQAIVNAAYTDFYGSPDGAPQVTIAPNEQEYTGQYDPSPHAIQLLQPASAHTSWSTKRPTPCCASLSERQTPTTSKRATARCSPPS